MSELAEIALVYERFPASVRGAVLVRGRDADPHQVTVRDVRAVDAADRARSATSIGFETATVDVAPHGEVVVPFDIPFGALEPGWYRVEADAIVDGQHRVRSAPDEKRFVVSWPPEDVRRGQIRVEDSVEVGGTKVEIQRVECRSDRALVRWGAEGDIELRVLAGRQRLPVLERSGLGRERTTVVYPVPKQQRALTFELTGEGASASTTVDLD